MDMKLSRRSFLKGAAATVAGLTASTVIAPAAIAEAPAPVGLVPDFQTGDKWEIGHFTVEAIVIDANSEPTNPNASFSVYHIMDYTAAVPYADSYNANGVTSDNNTSSMYVITAGSEALLLDLGNGASSTAAHFGENAEDAAVLDALNAEYRNVVLSLVGDRKLSIAITHQHGDHVGYSPAFAGTGCKVYFPEPDATDAMKERFADYDFETFVPGAPIAVGDITIDTLLCPGHTVGSTIFTIATPVITYNGTGDKASGTYLSFIGDAIGSGSSVWIFSADGLRQLNDGIDAVTATLEGYTAYDAGKGLQNNAKLLLLGGHGWQYENRMGTMAMDINYVRGMQNMIHVLSDGSRWVFVPDEGNEMEAALRKGHVVLKDAHNSWGNMHTAYFGTTLCSVGAVTCPLAALQEYAGIQAE